MSDISNFEHATCNLCGHDDISLLYRVNPVRRNHNGEFNLVKCRQCGLIYTNPRPDSKAILSYYPENYEYHEVRNASFLEKLYYRYFRRIPDIKKGTVLDVGCGNGNYLYFLKINGWDCYGTEINDLMIDRMVNKLGLKIFKGELYNIDFQERYFDVITFWGSLEHMSDPSKVLEKTYKLLKVGGKVIIWLNNIESFEARVFKRYWHHLEVPTHYYQFSPATLTNLLKCNKFKIEKVRFDIISFGIVPSIGYILNKKYNINMNTNKLILKLIFMPLDILLSFFKNSGLITIYATK